MVDNRLAILPYYNDKAKLLKDLRKEDRKELNAAAKHCGIKPHLVINSCVDKAVENWSIFYDTCLLGCAGVGKHPLDEQKGGVWLFSTKYANKYPKSYVKAVKWLINRALEVFPAGVYTATDAEYTTALKLNKILGFEKLENSVIIGGRETFIYFKEK
jgi:hypothetical protein